MNVLAKNLMILASAGSGKTYQLGNRVIGKIALEGVDPERMVALTFTRKAAGEFADSVLMKLAKGVLDSEEATELSQALGAEIEVGEVLEKVVAALPRLQLTTMDGFFSRVVRSFQYELGITGGAFDLLQGERKKLAEAEIIDSVLRDGFTENEEFFHAFRRATLGQPGQGVRKTLDDFLEDWMSLWKTLAVDKIGVPAFGELPAVGDWSAQKVPLIQALRREGDPKVLEAILGAFEKHSIGRTIQLNALGERMMASLNVEGEISLKNGKGAIDFSADDWEKWRALFGLMIRCELSAAVERTQSVLELVALVDRAFETRLRRRGLLGFDDIKNLLGAGMRNEEGRLQREAIDYRLDARYDHWLLDEFQDTSYADWNGLATLVGEAVTDPEGGLFVVGDRKQAIYGWRGGDVTIFDDLIQAYQGKGENQLKTEPMSRSFRSCPAVLELVNAVCGNLDEIEGLFGKALRERWCWEDHESAKQELLGEAKVITVPKDDGGKAMVEQMKELKIGENNLSCGVLVRKGSEVERYADLLRGEGFEVIEEGVRKPGEDHAVGVVLVQVLAWLADPADRFAQEVIAMSPLNEILEQRFPGGWYSRWEGMLLAVQEQGYALVLESLLESEWEGISGYGRRRARDIFHALSEFDCGGEATPRAARDWVAGLQVSQTPGAAAVQVMTIHKSKGLGFDLVMLPELSDEQIPKATHFKVACGEGWLLDVPNKKVRERVPALQSAYEKWAADQQYEGMCLLYVALTRSKQGLYVYLNEQPPSRVKSGSAERWGSPANLIRQTLGENFQCGEARWAEGLPEREEEVVKSAYQLAEGLPLRSRSNPSERKNEVKGSPAGRRIGHEVHALFEKIGWLKKGEVPAQPLSQAGKMVEDALRVPAIHAFFEEGGGELYREQAFEMLYQGSWMSGVVDRLHVYRKGEEVQEIEVIDFKTDVVTSGAELMARYRGQMQSYQAAMAGVFGVGVEQVKCVLLSTHLGEVVKMDEPDVQGSLDL